MFSFPYGGCGLCWSIGDQTLYIHWSKGTQNAFTSCSGKAWVYLFTCTVSWAVHFEIVIDLTLSSFLRCYSSPDEDCLHVSSWTTVRLSNQPRESCRGLWIIHELSSIYQRSVFNGFLMWGMPPGRGDSLSAWCNHRYTSKQDWKRTGIMWSLYIHFSPYATAESCKYSDTVKK